MAVEVLIENFQNIQKLSFRIEGFCVLVGESNIGKTSVVRAIQCVTENTPAKAFVRHGSKAPAKVQIAFPSAPNVKLSDGSPAKAVLVEWTRAKSVSYKVVKVSADGQKEVEEFERVGRGVPDHISALRLLRIETPELQALVGLVRQGRYFWPLDDPNSIVKLIGELRSVVALNTALNTAKAERRGAKKERDHLDRVLMEAEQDRKKLDGSEALDVDLVELQKAGSSVGVAELKQAKLLGFRDRVQKIKEMYQPIQEELSRLQGVDSLDAKIALVGQDRGQYLKLGHKVERLRSLQLRWETLTKTLEKNDLQIDTSVVDVKLTSLQEITQRLRSLRTIRDRLSKVQVRSLPGISIPAFDVVVGTAEKVNRLRQVYSSLTVVASKLKGVDEELGECHSEQERIDRDFGDFRLRYPNCPVCGSPLNEIE